jgi:beta-lactamase superfamily II metal-dependent hydrolase
MEDQMEKCFSTEMLPASDGDSLWIEYGDPENPSRILIDGGRADTAKEITKRLKKVPVGQLQDGKVVFELLVITHIDNDHIQGILKLLENSNSPLQFSDVWFNGFNHLNKTATPAEFITMGPLEGERLTDILLKRSIPWNNNKVFEGRSVVVPEDKSPLIVPLGGGMVLTLLSPSWTKLERLRPVWEKACWDEGIDPNHPEVEVEITQPGWKSMGPIDIEDLAASKFMPDTTETNGSSIAFIAEYDGHRILFGGDAHADLLLESIERVKGLEKKLKLDAFKIPHHGSDSNVSNELIQAVDCQRFLVSTGASEKRPARQTIARVIKSGGEQPELIFNSLSDNCRQWDNKGLMQEFGYSVRYPEQAGQSVSLILE